MNLFNTKSNEIKAFYAIWWRLLYSSFGRAHGSTDTAVWLLSVTNNNSDFG